MNDDVYELVITAPDPEWLVHFSRSLVEEHLAAAARHPTQIRSIYRWEGEMYDR